MFSSFNMLAGFINDATCNILKNIKFIGNLSMESIFIINLVFYKNIFTEKKTIWTVIRSVGRLKIYIEDDLCKMFSMIKKALQVLGRRYFSKK